MQNKATLALQLQEESAPTAANLVDRRGAYKNKSTYASYAKRASKPIAHSFQLLPAINSPFPLSSYHQVHTRIRPGVLPPTRGTQPAAEGAT